MAGQFGPDHFTRNDKEGKPVAAKWLKDANGQYAIDPLTQKPYVVPDNYDAAAVIAQFSNAAAAIKLGTSLLPGYPNALAQREALYAYFAYQFRAGGPSDLQRSTSNGILVPDFINAASYSLGLAASATGLSVVEPVLGGGLYNGAKALWDKYVNGKNYINTDGTFWNAKNPNKNQDNAASINTGYRAGKNGIFGAPSTSTGPLGFTLSANGANMAFFDGSVSTLATNTGGSSIGTFNSVNGSTAITNFTNYGSVSSESSRTVNGDGTYTISNADANGSATSTTYNVSDNSVINKSVIQTDGSRTDTSYVNRNVTEVRTTNADGSSSRIGYSNNTVTFEHSWNADGSYYGRDFFANGAVSVEQTYNLDLSWRRMVYNADGSVSSYAIINSDGSGSIQTSIDNYYDAYSLRFTGDYYTSINVSWDANGSKVIKEYSYNNRLHAQTKIAADGSGIRTIVNPAIDSLGDTVYTWDANGVGTVSYPAHWNLGIYVPGGTYASDCPYEISQISDPNRWAEKGIGPFSLSTTWANQDGSATTYTSSPSGVLLAMEMTFPDESRSSTNYFADGVPKKSTYSNVGGSSGIMTYYGNGNVASNETTYSNGSFSLASYDPVGRIQSDSWRNADGTSGFDTFNADGSSSGVAYSADGSYYSYTDNGVGSITSSNRSANNIKLSDSWVAANGTAGSNVFNTDGSCTSEIYSANGSITSQSVTFAQGIVPADLQLSWGQTIGAISGLSADPQLNYTTLNLSWGTDNQSIQVMIPHSDDPLGTGVSAFTFADGSTLVLAQLITMAPMPTPTFDPQIFDYLPGMGDRVLGAGYNSIRFGAGITSEMITLGIGAGSLTLNVGADGDVIHITNFNPSNALAPNIINCFSFADNSTITYDQLLTRGFDIYGTTGNETLSGSNLDNRIYAVGGNNTLIGTGANDTLVSGEGVDTLIGGTGNETFVINNAGDAVSPNASAASNSIISSVSYVLPRDVQNITLTGYVNLKATGNDLDNIITGNAGDNSLIGGGGNDTLFGGEGDDTLTGGSVLVGGAGNDTMDGAGSGTGGTRYLIDPAQTGVDLISDTGDSEQAYKDWYYSTHGIANWRESVLAGGMYAVDGEFGSIPSFLLTDDSGGDYRFYYTPDQFPAIQAEDPQLADYILNHPQRIAYIEPLPPFELPAANDYAALQPFYDAGLIPMDTVEFAAGIALTDLSMSWGHKAGRTTLDLSWNNDASQARLVLPNADDPLGFGVEQVKFADGTVVGIADMLGRIADFQLGMGFQVVDNHDKSIQFGEGISAGNTQFLLQGADLLIKYGTQGDSVLIKGFAPNGVMNNQVIVPFQFVDGGKASYTTDGQGNSTIIAYDANDILVGYFSQWQDGGNHGNNASNADGSSSGSDYYLDGSYVTYTANGHGVFNMLDYAANGGLTRSIIEDGPGNRTVTFYDGNGRKLNDYWTRADGSFGDDTFNADGSYEVHINDGLGTDTTVIYDVNGIKLNDFWFKTDGSNGYDVYNADGSSSGTMVYVDGSHSSYTNDGQGEVMTQYFANGIKISDSWTKADGTYGSDYFNVDGSINGMVHNVDGSYSTTTINAWGDISMYSYDANDNLLGDSWQNSEGYYSSNTYMYGTDGNLLSTAWQDSTGAHGTDNYTYGTDGNLLSTTWQDSTGSHGTNNADGSNNGTWYNGDGSYTTYTDDGQGTYNGLDYGAGGNKIGDSWGKADGSSGYDAYNIDGSSSGMVNNPDGSSYSYLNDGQGNNTLIAETGGVTLTGDLGNNIFVVNDIRDVVQAQSTGSNINTILSSVDFVAPVNVQNLTLTGTADINGMGNELGNAITGNSGKNVLDGGAGDDVLYGGLGNDTLIGGAGNDIYLINADDGVVTIIDDFADAEYNTIIFGAGVDPAGVKLFQGSLGMDLGNGTVVHIQGVDYNDIANTSSIQNFQFADATVLTAQELVARGFDSTGGADDDTLSGTNVTDRMNAGAGDDALTGGGGDDVLDGGTGNDTLIGGTGNDTYVFNLGDGADIIVDAAISPAGAEINTLVLGAGITAAMIAPVVGATGEVTLDFGNGDSVRINRVGDLSIQNVQFADGSVIGAESLLNAPPVAVADAVTVSENSAQAHITIASLLANDTDPDAGDALGMVGFDTVTAQGYAVSLDASGDLVFDIGNLYQSLAEGQAAIDTFGYSIADLAGAASTANVVMTITGVNDAPVTVDDAAAAQECGELTATGNVLSNDTDVDAGAVLAVSDAGMRQGNFGSIELAADGSYTYALNNSAAAVQSLAAGETVFDSFSYLASDGVTATPGVLSVAIAGRNDIPVLAKPLSDKQLAKNTDVSWKIPDNSFADIDRNDTLSYSAKLASGSALPSWLKFDAATQTFSGHVPGNAKDSLDIRVAASDGHGANSSAVDVFSISFGKDSGCGKGNEGVGNGQDSPPPGHDNNWNDGPGTSPGNPGSCGGNSQDSSHSSSGQSCDNKKDSEKSWGGQDKSSSFAYVDLKLVDHHRDALGGNMEKCGAPAANDETDYYRRWVDVDLKVSRMRADGDNLPSWLDPAHGADIGALSGIAHNTGGAGNRSGVDAISLSAGSGTCLKGFRGLQEGMARLG